jgi:hypothetical protein
LPAAAALWDVVVVDKEGAEVKVAQGQCVVCSQLACSTPNMPANRHQTSAGKENAHKEDLAFLTQKLAALDSIITRRRSMVKDRKVSTPTVPLYSLLIVADCPTLHACVRPPQHSL